MGPYTIINDISDNIAIITESGDKIVLFDRNYGIPHHDKVKDILEFMAYQYRLHGNFADFMLSDAKLDEMCFLLEMNHFDVTKWRTSLISNHVNNFIMEIKIRNLTKTIMFENENEMIKTIDMELRNLTYIQEHATISGWRRDVTGRSLIISNDTTKYSIEDSIFYKIDNYVFED